MAIEPWTTCSVHGANETLTTADLIKLIKRSREISLAVTDDRTIRLERNARGKWMIEDGRANPKQAGFSDCKVVDEIAPHATGIHRNKVQATTPDGKIVLFYQGFTGLSPE